MKTSGDSARHCRTPTPEVNGCDLTQPTRTHARGTRLDDARGKKQVWRPHSDSEPGELCPYCPPSLHPWHIFLIKNAMTWWSVAGGHHVFPQHSPQLFTKNPVSTKHV